MKLCFQKMLISGDPAISSDDEISYIYRAVGLAVTCIFCEQCYPIVLSRENLEKIYFFPVIWSSRVILFQFTKENLQV